jgi:hypothetical protein
MPITAKEVNEAAGSAEAKVAAQRSAGARTPARRGKEAKSYRAKPGQPEATKSVADEIARRKKSGPARANFPSVRLKGERPKSKTEAQSDKSWSRATVGQSKRSGRA